MNIAWAYLLLAGFCELGFTTCLKLSENFSKLPYAIGFFVFAISSFFFLNRSLVSIPLGTAYAVWTGIGAFGTALIGIMLFGEPVSVIRVLLLTTLIGSVAGLKFLAH